MHTPMTSVLRRPRPVGRWLQAPYYGRTAWAVQGNFDSISTPDASVSTSVSSASSSSSSAAVQPPSLPSSAAYSASSSSFSAAASSSPPFPSAGFFYLQRGFSSGRGGYAREALGEGTKLVGGTSVEAATERLLSHLDEALVTSLERGTHYSPSLDDLEATARRGLKKLGCRNIAVLDQCQLGDRGIVGELQNGTRIQAWSRSSGAIHWQIPTISALTDLLAEASATGDLQTQSAIMMALLKYGEGRKESFFLSNDANGSMVVGYKFGPLHPEVVESPPALAAQLEATLTMVEQEARIIGLECKMLAASRGSPQALPINNGNSFQQLPVTNGTSGEQQALVTNESSGQQPLPSKEAQAVPHTLMKEEKEPEKPESSGSSAFASAFASASPTPASQGGPPANLSSAEPTPSVETAAAAQPTSAAVAKPDKKDEPETKPSLQGETKAPENPKEKQVHTPSAAATAYAAAAAAASATAAASIAAKDVAGKMGAMSAAKASETVDPVKSEPAVHHTEDKAAPAATGESAETTSKLEASSRSPDREAKTSADADAKQEAPADPEATSTTTTTTTPNAKGEEPSSSSSSSSSSSTTTSAANSADVEIAKAWFDKVFDHYLVAHTSAIYEGDTALNSFEAKVQDTPERKLGKPFYTTTDMDYKHFVENKQVYIDAAAQRNVTLEVEAHPKGHHLLRFKPRP